MQETSNAVMAALLIHDIRNKNGVAQPSYKLSNPLELFSIGSHSFTSPHQHISSFFYLILPFSHSGGFHGGNWRTAYTMNTLGTPAYLWGVITLNKVQVLAALACFGGLIAAFFIYGPPHRWGFF